MQRRKFLTTLGGLLFAGGAGCLRTPPLAHSSVFQTETAELGRRVTELMSEFKVPGASIAFVRDGQTIGLHHVGVKDVKTREPVDDDTLFEAASVSKTVFAYAA